MTPRTIYVRGEKDGYPNAMLAVVVEDTEGKWHLGVPGSGREYAHFDDLDSALDSLAKELRQ